MKGLLEYAVTHSGLGLLPAAGVVVLMATMIGIIAWTFRPKARAEYEKQSMLTLK